MVGGPEPVRLPARGVSGWGLLPRHRTHDEHGPGPGAHRDRPDGGAPAPEVDVEVDGEGDRGEQPRHRSELWHDRTEHSAEGSAWRHGSAAIRDREEPGHLNRQA